MFSFCFPPPDAIFLPARAPRAGQPKVPRAAASSRSGPAPARTPGEPGCRPVRAVAQSAPPRPAPENAGSCADRPRAWRAPFGRFSRCQAASLRRTPSSGHRAKNSRRVFKAAPAARAGRAPRSAPGSAHDHRRSTRSAPPPTPVYPRPAIPYPPACPACRHLAPRSRSRPR